MLSEHERELGGLLNLLETADRQITPEHVSQRYRELLCDIRDDGGRGGRVRRVRGLIDPDLDTGRPPPAGN